MGDSDHFQNAVLFHPVAGFPEGNVGGHMDHSQVLVGQHHGVFLGAGVIRIDLGVAGVMVSRQVHGLLVQRVGHRGVHLFVHSQFNDLLHIPEGRISGHGGDLSPLQLLHVHHTHVVDVDDAVFVLRFAYVPDLMDFQLMGEAGKL